MLYMYLSKKSTTPASRGKHDFMLHLHLGHARIDDPHPTSTRTNNLGTSRRLPDTTFRAVATIAVANFLERRVALVTLTRFIFTEPILEVKEVSWKCIKVMDDLETFNLPNVIHGVITNQSELDDLIFGNGTVEMIVKVVVKDDKRLDLLAVVGAVLFNHGLFLLLFSSLMKGTVIRIDADLIMSTEMPVTAVRFVEINIGRHGTNFRDETGETEP